MTKLNALFLLLAVIAVVLSSALFTVDEREQALVFQFGKFQQAYTEPGLKAKIPLIQEVVKYPTQTLIIEPEEEKAKLKGQEFLNVDSYALFKISDPLKFYKRLRTLNNAQDNIGSRLTSNLLEILARYTLSEVLSTKRAGIMNKIKNNVNEDIESLGVQLIDVRIGRAELPVENRNRVFKRMQAERNKEASKTRAEGEETAQKIRADADRQKTVLIATATQESQQIRGEGDSKAIKVYADAFNKDPQFYEFYRSLEAYRNSLADEGTTLVLSPDSQFFKFFNQSR